MKRRHAFTVTELLVTVGLFAAFATIAGKLMNTTIRLSHDAGYAQNASDAFDAAVRSIRKDVWSARGIQIMNDRAMRLTLGDGASVDWTVDEAGVFTREPKGDPPRRWNTTAAGLALARDGPAVVLRLPRTARARGGEVRLTSEILLVERIGS